MLSLEARSDYSLWVSVTDWLISLLFLLLFLEAAFSRGWIAAWTFLTLLLVALGILTLFFWGLRRLLTRCPNPRDSWWKFGSHYKLRLFMGGPLQCLYCPGPWPLCVPLAWLLLQWDQAPVSRLLSMTKRVHSSYQWPEWLQPCCSWVWLLWKLHSTSCYWYRFAETSADSEFVGETADTTVMEVLVSA